MTWPGRLKWWRAIAAPAVLMAQASVPNVPPPASLGFFQTHPPAWFDLNCDGTLDVLDLQLATRQAIGSCSSATFNGDAKCSVLDLQVLVSAVALGGVPAYPMGLPARCSVQNDLVIEQMPGAIAQHVPLHFLGSQGTAVQRDGMIDPDRGAVRKIPVKALETDR